jgi:hypothetical protein
MTVLTVLRDGSGRRRGRRPEVQLTAPRSRSLRRVGSQLEHVVRRRPKTVDCQRRLRGVRRPVVDRVVAIVIQQLVEDNDAVAVTFSRRFPLQPDRRRTEGGCGEIQRRTLGYCGRRKTSNKTCAALMRCHSFGTRQTHASF